MAGKRGYCEEDKAVIFDLDGTLITLPVNYDRLRERLRSLLKTDHPIKPLFESIEALTKEERSLRARAYEIVYEEEGVAIDALKPRRGLKKVLKTLKGKGFRIGLVTLQGKTTATRALEKIGVSDLFDIVITREHSIDREAQIRHALRMLGTESGVMIGDRIEDMKAGQSLGCMTIGTSKSPKRRKLLRETMPRSVISNLAELLEILSN